METSGERGRGRCSRWKSDMTSGESGGQDTAASEVEASGGVQTGGAVKTGNMTRGEAGGAEVEAGGGEVEAGGAVRGGAAMWRG